MMNALKILKNGKIKYCQTLQPKLKPGWCLIKVKASGLCGSDIQKIFSDEISRKRIKTRIWGHEISGVIYQISSKSEYKVNDRVAVIPLIFSDSCEITTAKSIGKDYPGGFADYCLVPINNIRKIPSSLSFELATLIDAVAVAQHAYKQGGRPIRNKVLIIGDGPLALTLGAVLRHYKNDVHVIGKNTHNLLLAKKIGLLDINQETISDQYDVVFEVVGRNQNETIKIAINSIKPKGKIVVLGVYQAEFLNKIVLRNCFYKEASIVGSNSYIVNTKIDEFTEAIQLVIKHKRLFSPIITHMLPLEDFSKSLLLLKDKKNSRAIKIVFHP